MISKSELKFIRSLKIKKYRTAEKRFLVEGEKNVLELLSSDYKVDRLFVTAEFSRTHETNLRKAPHTLVSPKELESASHLTTNDQALAIVHMKDQSSASLDVSKIIIALDGVGDPGNMGTIIRTMDWFGFNQLICSEDCVDFYNPKVIQSTMGSFTRVKVVHLNLPSFLRSYKGAKFGTDMSGIPITEATFAAPSIVVMGSESHGIREAIRPMLNEFVTINKLGNAESLNVAIATGILCHQISSCRS